MSSPHNLIGKRFGRLTVIERANNDKYGKRMWICKCDCGKIKEKPVVSNSLIKGKTTSCGCYMKEAMKIVNAKSKTTHGMTNSRLFTIWKGMKARCYNPNDISYKRYGGKGVTVCEQWHKFENFMKWAFQSGYNDNLSIDRIDNTKGYTPDNCRWATAMQQSNNRSNNRNVHYKGQEYTIAELSRKLGIHPCTLRCRINRGWNSDDLGKKPIVKGAK